MTGPPPPGSSSDVGRTGAEQQLPDFAPGVAIRDFDIPRDGREAVLEQPP